jgi:hypothetical protein
MRQSTIHARTLCIFRVLPALFVSVSVRCKRILSVCSMAIGVWLVAYGCDHDEINDFYGVTYISGFGGNLPRGSASIQP